MLHSVGERVEGTQPEREQGKSDGSLQEKLEESGVRGAGRWWMLKDIQKAVKPKNVKNREKGGRSTVSRRVHSKLYTVEKRAACIQVSHLSPFIDCVNIMWAASCQSSSDCRPNRGAVHVRKNTQANIRSKERDVLEAAWFEDRMLKMQLSSMSKTEGLEARLKIQEQTLMMKQTLTSIQVQSA